MIPVKVFRNNLATYLRKVARGTELIITKRDKPVARVTKYEEK